MARKIFPNVEALMPALLALTHEELGEIDHKLHAGRMYGEKGLLTLAYDREEPIRQAQYAKERQEYELRKKLEAEDAPKRVKYLKTLLKKGMTVKCKGCKDGRGIREIESINEDSITGWKVATYWPTGKLTRTNMVTTNGIDKISHVMANKNWISVKDLMKNSFTSVNHE